MNYFIHSENNCKNFIFISILNMNKILYVFESKKVLKKLTYYIDLKQKKKINI